MAQKKSDSERNSIGQRLQAMRLKKKTSIEELSEKTGISVTHLKNIESGKDFAPVGDILKIARALTVDPVEILLPGMAREKELEKKRVQDFQKRIEAYQYEVLTPHAGNDHLRAFKVSIPPRSEHPKISYHHEGEEFVYVLKGKVEITVGQKKHLLGKDDCLHFNSGIKHSLRNPGSVTTLLIVAIYNP